MSELDINEPIQDSDVELEEPIIPRAGMIPFGYAKRFGVLLEDRGD
jgi:hypothetical protein